MKSKLVKFRIFAAREKFRESKASRPVEEYRLKGGLVVNVAVGPIPKHLVGMHVLAGPILSSALTGVVEPKPESVPADWEAKGVVYTSIVIEQEQEVASDGNRATHSLFWYDWPTAESICSEFNSRARSVLDGVTAKLVGTLGADLLYRHLHDSRVYIAAEGKATQPIIELRFGDPNVQLMRSATDLDLKGLRALKIKSEDEVLGKKTVGRWFTLAAGEPDPFKRLMWAYAGIEVLSRRAADKWRDDAIAALGGNEIAASIAKELLWPKGRDESIDPYRNTTFRFALMALVASRQTAGDDIQIFKAVSDFRNRIHGREIDERLTPQHASAAIDLLRRYTPLVANLF